MKGKLELELTREQYQQLLECFYVGSIRLSKNVWPVNQDGKEIERSILSQAKKFEAEDLIYNPPYGGWTISHQVEDRISPFIFDD